MCPMEFQALACGMAMQALMASTIKERKRNFIRVLSVEPLNCHKGRSADGAFLDAQRLSHSWCRIGQRIFTARAASRATVVKEMNDCTIIMSLAHRERTGTSVGENAVLVLKARNR